MPGRLRGLLPEGAPRRDACAAHSSGEGPMPGRLRCSLPEGAGPLRQGKNTGDGSLQMTTWTQPQLLSPCSFVKLDTPGSILRICRLRS